MAANDVLFEINEMGIATITFNRPDKLNALTSEMLDCTLPDLFRRVHEDDDIRLLIITGAGRGFCAGADVEERLQGMQTGKLKLGFKYYTERVAQFTVALADIGKPVLAAVNGQAAGVGFSLCLLADFRVASENAKFCAVFSRRGMVPDGGMTRTLQMIVGYPKALELMMTADNIDAAEALRIGLVNKVVPPDQLISEMGAFAEKLLRNAPLSLSFIKQAAQHGWSSNFVSQLEFESWGQVICRHSEDIKEGINSFLEKRPANFKGR
jgi:2-(1,2-epoxy-1,2-dihydrophenyl)acetyl-CoA isomerase